MADTQASIVLNTELRIDESKLQASLNRVEKNFKFNSPFAGANNDLNQFDKSLDRANQRVITFGASIAVLGASIKILKDIVSSTIEVEAAFTDINSVFQLSSKNLDTFSKGLFDVARQTSQSFAKAADAAKEFSRQGLSSEETLKRTRDALILTRLASVDTTEAVNVLTASVNGFQKSGLDTTEVLNKLATVDQNFAVSSKDLAEGISRAGAAASDAGVSFDQLIGLITAAQQTTARGGAIIGNSLKTIFTRLGRNQVLDEFESLGVKIKDINGNILPTIELLKNFSNTYDHLTGSIKKQAAELVGGVYQINILKALVQDLSRSNGIYAQSVDVSAHATDQAIARNNALNKSFASLLEQVNITNKQIFSNIGNQTFSGVGKSVIKFGLDNPITNALKDASGEAKTSGGQFAEGFLKGFGNSILIGLGPILLRAGSAVIARTFKNVFKDVASESGLIKNQRQTEEAEKTVQQYIKGERALKAQLTTFDELNASAVRFNAIMASISNIKLPSIGGLTNTNSNLIGKVLNGGTLNNLQVYSLRKQILGNVASELNPNIVFPDSGSLNGIRKSLLASASIQYAPQRQALEEHLLNTHPGLSTGGGTLVPLSLLEGTPLAQQEIQRVRKQANDLIDQAIDEDVKAKLKDIEAQTQIHLGNITGRSKFNQYERVQNSLAQQEREASGIAIFRANSALTNRNNSIIGGIFGSSRGDVAALRKEFGGRELTDLEQASSLGGLVSLRNSRAIKQRNLGFGLAFGAPLLAGFVPNGQGATGGGIALGGASGALNGIGLGASLGQFGGPVAALVGAGIGGILGAAFGAIAKINKSFEELANEIEDSNKKNAEQINTAANALNISQQIVEGRQGGASEKNINRLEREFTSEISKIKNPEVRKLLLNNITDPDIYAKVQEAQAKDTEQLNSKNGIKTVAANLSNNSNFGKLFSGILGSGIVGGFTPGNIDISGFLPDEKGVTESSGALQSALSKLNPTQLKALESLSKNPNANPKDIIKSLGKATGLNTQEITGRSDITGLDSSFLSQTISEAVSKRKKDLEEGSQSDVTKQIKEEVERLDALNNLVSKYRQKADSIGLQSASSLKINEAFQQTVLSRPQTEESKIILSGQQQLENIQGSSYFNTQQISAQLGSALLGTIQKFGDSKANRGALENVITSSNPLEAALSLRQKLSTQEGKAELAGLDNLHTRDALNKLIEALDKETKSTILNTETVKNLTKIQLDEYKRRNSIEGATSDAFGNSQISGENLRNAINRNAPSSTIRGLKATDNISVLETLRTARVITQEQFNRDSNRERSTAFFGDFNETGAGALDAARKTAAGYKASPYSTGAQIAGSSLAVAQEQGIGGDALGSLKGGFNSVFEGFKKDANQFAQIGADLATKLSDSLGNAFGDFITGAKSAKDAFKSFAVSILSDASRALASKAIQTLLSAFLGSFEGGGTVTPKKAANGGIMGMASGGMVPALVMGGEYYINPQAARRIGYQTLNKLNRYADGGMISGGSGYEDDIPANLPSGSFIMRKSAVNKLGPQYLNALVNGGVQHRDGGGILGALIGAIIGGGVGYATGGKKGALIGAGIGAVGGYFAGSAYSNSNNSGPGTVTNSNLPSADSLKFGSQSNAFGDLSAKIGADTTSSSGGWFNSLTSTQKALVGLGAAGVLGVAAAAIGKQKTPPGAISNSQVGAYATNLENTQLAYLSSAGAGKYPYLQLNPQGGYSLAGFGDAPATRRFADGGAVDSPMLSGGSSATAPQVNIKIDINNNGNATSSGTSNNKDGAFGEGFADKLQKQVRGIVVDELVHQSRSDGILARGNPLGVGRA